MASSHSRLLRNLAVVTGAAGAIGFLSVPVLLHLTTQPNAIGKLIAEPAEAQTVQGAGGSDSGVDDSSNAAPQQSTTQQAPASPQGSQPLQEQTIPPFGQSGNATQPLFQTNQTGETAQPTTGAQGSQPIQTQTAPGTSTNGQTTGNPGGRTLPEQAAPGAQRVTAPTGSASPTGQTVPGQVAPGRFSNGTDGTNGRTQQSVPIGGSAPVTGGGTNARSTQPTTVISPGVLGSQTTRQAPAFAQGAQPVQSPATQVPATQVPATQTAPAQTVTPVQPSPTATTTETTVDQTTTTAPAGTQTTQPFTTTQTDAQYGQAVRALW